MRRTVRIAGRTVAVLLLVGAAFWAFGPYEPVDLDAGFEPRRFGEGVQVYFESTESAHDDITPGTERQVIWRDGFKEQRTPVSLLYVHGFSASSHEIRPVPDQLAAALGANLVLTRLTGHGRGGDALAGATVNDWMQDMAEGLAAARATGDRVVVLATSTGATLAALAALDPEMSRDVAAMIFLSPNFGINNPAARLLTWPAARYWLPLVAGESRGFTPQNDLHATYWTTRYPTVALLPMAALVRHAARADYTGVTIPLLVRLSDEDRVVRPDLAREVLARWGGGATVQAVTLGDGDDPFAHVIAGGTLSPSQTRPTVAALRAWLSDQGIE